MRLLISVALLLLSLNTFAQTFTVAAKPEDVGMSGARLSKIDKVIEEHIANKWIPGAVVFIARNGKVVYHKAFGYADVENKTALKKDNIFRIASHSKSVTSLAVMMLYEDGKFGLDDPISKYIPEFKSPKVLVSLNWRDTTYTTVPAKSEITIRQLLTHTSGIDYAAIGSQEFKAIYAKAGVPSGIGNHNMVLADKMKILGGLPIKHHPGEAYTYGLNYDVLGYLVEVLSGMPFDQYMRTKIFQPIGMNSTYFYQPKENHSRVVSLYDFKDGLISKITAKPFDDVEPMYPTLNGTYFSGGAGLSSTAEDNARFLQLYLNKGEYNGVRLLSRKTVEMILTPQQLAPPIQNQVGLGFGLETEKNDYQNIYSLGTFSWGGAYNSQYWADPKEKLVGIIFMNTYGGPGRDTANKVKVLTYQAIVD